MITEIFSKDFSSKQLNKNLPIVSEPGWSPLHQTEAYGGNIYVKIWDYYNSEEDADINTKPPYIGWYLSSTGLVNDITQATPINQVTGININEYVNINPYPIDDPGQVPYTVYNEYDEHIYGWNGSTWVDLGKLTPDVSDKVSKISSTTNAIVLFNDTQGTLKDSGTVINPSTTLGNSQTSLPSEKVVYDALEVVSNDLSLTINNVASDLADHIGDTANPHEVTIEQITPTTTTGDLMVHTDTGVSRLPVGSNNQILVADDTTDEGMKWIDQPEGDYVKTGLFTQPWQLITLSTTGTTTDYNITANYVKVNVIPYNSTARLILPTPSINYNDTEVFIEVNSKRGKTQLFSGSTSMLIGNLVGGDLFIIRCTHTGSGYNWVLDSYSGKKMTTDSSVFNYHTTGISVSGDFTPGIYYITNGTGSSFSLSMSTPLVHQKGKSVTCSIELLETGKSVTFNLFNQSGVVYDTITETTGNCTYIFTAVDDTTFPQLKIVYYRIGNGNLIDEDDMVSDRDDIAPSQQSVKAYLDNNLDALNTIVPYSIIPISPYSGTINAFYRLGILYVTGNIQSSSTNEAVAFEITGYTANCNTYCAAAPDHTADLTETGTIKINSGSYSVYARLWKAGYDFMFNMAIPVTTT